MVTEFKFDQYIQVVEANLKTEQQLNEFIDEHINKILLQVVQKNLMMAHHVYKQYQKQLMIVINYQMKEIDSYLTTWFFVKRNIQIFGKRKY